MDGRFKYKIIKCLGENLQGLGFGEELVLRHHTKSRIQKIKIDKLDFIRIKNFFSWKTLVRGWKATDLEKVFTNHISNKGLVSCKFKNSQNKNKKIQLENAQNNMSRHFNEED